MSREASLIYAEKNFDEFVDKLIDLCAIPSISFAPYPPSELEKAAWLTKDFFQQAGLENTKLITIEGAPSYVYAEHFIDANLPTVLLYAHYDVQPTMREHLWRSKPFAAETRGNRLYGRGTFRR